MQDTGQDTKEGCNIHLQLPVKTKKTANNNSLPKYNESNLRKMFRYNIFHKTLQSPLKARNTGG